MALSLIFTGWDQPVLPSVANWLIQHYTAPDGTVDLSPLVMVMPGNRSGRRLLELLVQGVEAASQGPGDRSGRGHASQGHASQGHASPLTQARTASSSLGRVGPRVLIPPSFETLGGLPEHLYSSPIPLAEPTEGLLIRARMLEENGQEALTQLSMCPPPGAPLREWIAVARELERLDTELAAALLTPTDVASRCEALHIPFETPRWEALGLLSEQYQARLEAHNLTDRNAARRKALASGELSSDKVLCLVSLPDLSPLSAAFVRAASSQVLAFVFAPEHLREGFDGVGAFHTGFWAARPIPLEVSGTAQSGHLRQPPVPGTQPGIQPGSAKGVAPHSHHSSSHICIVDRPRDQASAVLQTLESLQGRYSAEQITIGLADEELTSLVERALDLAGLPARPAVGSPLNRAPVFQLLRSIAELLEQPRPDRLAGLMRHPDLEPLCFDALGGKGSRDWITLMDRFSGEFLPQVLPDELLGELEAASTSSVERRAEEQGRQSQGSEAGSAQLKNEHAKNEHFRSELWQPLVLISRAIRSLLPNAQERATLSQWAEFVRQLLRKVYAGRRLKRFEEADSRQIHALQGLIGALNGWDRLRQDDGPGANLLASDALRLLLAELESGVVPSLEDPTALELLGWLELSLDDADVLVVVGFNEGKVPASSSADPFLPDRLRRELGLTDNGRRYARDALFLSQMLACRPHVTLIAGRRGVDGDPLVPSRLLFADSPQVVATRIQTFYQSEPEEAHGPVRLWLPAGAADDPRVPAYEVPPPELSSEVLTKMRVTAFRSWLMCKYRFYLQHILKLEGLNDQGQELDAMQFGTLAHTVLQRFGEGPIRNTSDSQQIHRYLVEVLDDTVRNTFGTGRRPAVELQLRFLRQRLERFAEWQAEQRRQGWQIQAVEQRLTFPYVVDGEPFLIEGQVDRIDVHGDGKHRILDYKTSDRKKNPNQTHLKKGKDGEVEWVDLQLPLYQVMAEGAKLVGPTTSLGYIALASDASASDMLQEARFEAEQLQEARQVASRVIRGIRARDFWPPNYEVSDEQYASLTFEHCVDRHSFRLNVEED